MSEQVAWMLGCICVSVMFFAGFVLGISAEHWSKRRSRERAEEVNQHEPSA